MIADVLASAVDPRPVNEGSFAAFHPVGPVSRNWISRRCCDWPPGWMFCPTQDSSTYPRVPPALTPLPAAIPLPVAVQCRVPLPIESLQHPLSVYNELLALEVQG